MMSNQKSNTRQYEIIIVDDNSPDKTQEVIIELQKMNNNIKLVSRPKKLGLGSAYRDGGQAASGDFIILMDADLSHHPKYLKDFIR